MSKEVNIQFRGKPQFRRLLKDEAGKRGISVQALIEQAVNLYLGEVGPRDVVVRLEPQMALDVQATADDLGISKDGAILLALDRGLKQVAPADSTIPDDDLPALRRLSVEEREQAETFVRFLRVGDEGQRRVVRFILDEHRRIMVERSKVRDARNKRKGVVSF